MWGVLIQVWVVMYEMCENCRDVRELEAEELGRSLSS